MSQDLYFLHNTYFLYFSIYHNGNVLFYNLKKRSPDMLFKGKKT